MLISIDTDRIMFKVKQSISNFFYTFGMKIYFDHPPVKFLENTKDLNSQFNNLLEYYKELQGRQAYYQRPEWNGKFSHKKFPAPTIELLPANEKGLKHYAMIWNNHSFDRYVKVTYREDGLLGWIQANRIPNSKNSSGAGCGFVDIELIWELYSK